LSQAKKKLFVMMCLTEEKLLSRKFESINSPVASMNDVPKADARAFPLKAFHHCQNKHKRPKLLTSQMLLTDQLF